MHYTIYNCPKRAPPYLSIEITNSSARETLNYPEAANVRGNCAAIVGEFESGAALYMRCVLWLRGIAVMPIHGNQPSG